MPETVCKHCTKIFLIVILVLFYVGNIRNERKKKIFYVRNILKLEFLRNKRKNMDLTRDIILTRHRVFFRFLKGLDKFGPRTLRYFPYPKVVLLNLIHSYQVPSL